jgi:pimeloyl-ACP methyl ester carboxylesterase
VLLAGAGAGGGCALAGAGVDLKGYEAARSIAVQLASARWAAQERPDWRFMMIEEMGHTPQLEDPDLFVSIVNGWLRKTVNA